jgi:hypothetical protein
MSDRHGIATYPGLLGIQSCTYTCSHGISPGVVMIVSQPQPIFPAMFGDVTLSDGVGSVTVPGCRVDSVKSEINGGELTWTVYLQDRRWKWADFGVISGCYNQLDERGKLIPWTIRSPQELAILCLTAMEETGYTLQLPAGLTRAFGQGVDKYLTPGQLFPQTGLNPPVNWDAITPATALQQMADLFGCHVVYNLATDTVLVVPVGVGGTLPDGSIARYGPSLKTVALPDGVMVVGGPTKYQTRLDFSIAVGEEWDNTLVKINQLSYAPNIPASVQVTRVQFGSRRTFISTGLAYLTVNGVTLTYSASIGDTPATAVSTFITAFNTAKALPNSPLANITVFVSLGNAIDFTGQQNGFSFEVSVQAFGNFVWTDGFFGTPELITRACDGKCGWENSDADGDGFNDVVATDRLTYEQAREKALKSVFKWYQLSGDDVGPDTGKVSNPINVPGYGPIARKQQLVIDPTRVAQNIPQLPNEAFWNPNQDIDPTRTDNLSEFIQNYYDGVSRDLPAIAYGSYYPYAGGAASPIEHVNQDTRAYNTPGSEPIFVPFTIDPEFQVIKFEKPVYYADNPPTVGSVSPPSGPVLSPFVNTIYGNGEINVPFFYVVTALTVSGESARSNEVAYTPTVNLTAELSWTAVAGATAYRVYRSLTSGAYNSPSLLVHLNQTSLFYKDFGPASNRITGQRGPVLAPITPVAGGSIVNGNTIYYSVSSVTTMGETDRSDERTYTAAGGNDTAFIQWTSIPGAIGYRLYASASTTNASGIYGPSSIIAVGDESMLSYTDSVGPGGLVRPAVTQAAIVPITGGELPTGRTYRYVVTAILSRPGIIGYETDISNEKFFTPGGATQGARISWSSAGVLATSYRIYRSLRSGVYETRPYAIVSGGTLSYDDMGGSQPNFFTCGNGQPPPPSVRTVSGTWRILPVQVTLETGVFVRDNETNQLVAWTLRRPLGSEPGQKIFGDEIIKRPDIKIGVIGNYDFTLQLGRTAAIRARQAAGEMQIYDSTLTGATFLEDDPLFRANHYLDGAMLKYQLKSAQTVEYNGIVPIACDGAIAQVTWSIGGGKKSSTTASRNCEHSTYLPPYPARRRAELLRPANQRDEGAIDLMEAPA